jgi:hypothetical protein
MKKYLFIVLLVGVCFGQMKVYSEVPIGDTIRFSFDEEAIKIRGMDKKKITVKKNVVIDGTWLCTNVSDCNLSISWQYLDEKKSNSAWSKVKIGSSILVENVTELISGIKSLNRYSFKKYDVKADYKLKNATLIFRKGRFLELHEGNSGRGVLKIIDPEKFIIKLENWLSQKPK